MNKLNVVIYLLLLITFFVATQGCFIMYIINPASAPNKSIKKFKYYDPSFNLDHHNSFLKPVEDGYYRSFSDDGDDNDDDYKYYEIYFFFKKGILNFWSTVWPKGAEGDAMYYCNTNSRKIAPYACIYGAYTFLGKDTILFTRKSNEDFEKKYMGIIYKDSLVVKRLHSKKKYKTTTYRFISCPNTVVPEYID